MTEEYQRQPYDSALKSISDHLAPVNDVIGAREADCGGPIAYV